MRTALLLLIGLLLGACASHTDAAGVPASPSSLAASAAALEARTVALVGRRDDGSLRAYCSGVWVSRFAIMTARHCTHELAIGEGLQYATYSDVYNPGDLNERVEPNTREAVVLATDDAHDLALLGAITPPEHPSARLALSVVRPGQFVQAMGQPLGLWWSYSSGQVAAVRYLPSIADEDVSILFIQATAPISPGNSGCGLFDSNGDLIGIAHATFTRGQNVNLFIHFQYLDALMRSQPIQ